MLHDSRKLLGTAFEAAESGFSSEICRRAHQREREKEREKK
jgi:hypothetical protein